MTTSPLPDETTVAETSVEETSVDGTSTSTSQAELRTSDEMAGTAGVEEGGDEFEEDSAIGYHLPSITNDNHQHLTEWAEGLTNSDSPFAEAASAHYAEVGRFEMAIELCVADGLARKVAVVLWGVEALSSRAESIERYVRVKAADIEDLAAGIEARLRGGDVDGALSDLKSNLEDVTEPISFFAKKKGIGTKKIRARANDDLALVTAILDDLASL